MFNAHRPLPLEQAGPGIHIDDDINDSGGSSPRSTLPTATSPSSKPNLQPINIPMLALERASSWPMSNSPTLSPSNADPGNKGAPSLTSPLPPLSPISPFSSSSSLNVTTLRSSTDSDNNINYLETHHLHVAYSDAPNKRFRPTMEDKVVITPMSKVPGTFVGVYDGHGGRWVAEHVGTSLHKHFEQQLAGNGGDEEEAFTAAYEIVDEELRIQRALTIGTTSVTAYFDPTGRYITCANVGDSRLVVGTTHGTGKRLTVDHRPSEEKERICDGGSFVCGGRVNGILAISRALGDHAMKSVVIPTPHTVTHPLSAEDKFCIIACDGLWDVVEDSEAAKFVMKIMEETTSIPRDIVGKEAAKALVQLALEKGSTDNVSVVVVLFK